MEKYLLAHSLSLRHHIYHSIPQLSTPLSRKNPKEADFSTGSGNAETTRFPVGFYCVCCVCVLAVEAKYTVYNTSGGIVPGKLNVHLVPHSHDDVGWLKTIDQYYVGSNNSIQVACVQNVLDSLIPALMADKNRKFIFAEQAFVQRWWRDQGEAMKNTVKMLVNSGQLEFINGGMCMHDEATTHYIDMIDQTTLGHRFLKEDFNVTPRIGWQIDPFGHSAVQAYLLGAEVGFDSLFFARIDYQDRAKRSSDKALEVIWQGSKSRGSSSQIFTGAFYVGNYEPPTGFYFEFESDSPVVQDDTQLFDYNVQERVNDFVAAAISQANVTRSNHIMWTMGTDFNYQYAHTWFRNMDKLVHYVNQDGRVNAFYSTPSVYTDAKYDLHESWPLKTEDYFPYADRENSYWTGYFTSRPALKGYVRMMSGYYLAVRQLEFLKGRNESGPTTDSLADALAIVQHHDAVTGTEQQHVANDYAKRLSIGYKESEEVVATALGCMTQASTSECKSHVTNFKQVVLVYNPIGWKRTEIVRIPVVNENVNVRDSSGQSILSQLVPIVNASIANTNFYASAYLGKSSNVTPKYWFAFRAVVPPLGFSSYVISSDKPRASFLSKQFLYTFEWSQTGPVEIGSGSLKLVHSGINGKLMQYINSRSLVNTSVEQSYSYFTGYDRSVDFQASGAYVFRPNGSFPVLSEEKVPLTIFRGPLFDEAHQMINSWIYQITRVYKEKEHAEFEFVIGPIPIDDGFGKEIVTRIKSKIGNNKIFYTDSNGRDFLERIRDHRTDWDLQVNQPIAGNYYPINLGAYIKDDNSELSVLVDRSVGGSSVADGELEIMLHRRLLYDDSRGVAEALNETVCVEEKCLGLTIQGKYYVRIDPLGEGSKWRRSFGQEIYSPFILAFSEQDDEWTNFPTPTFSAVDPFYSLPNNVAIISLQELENGNALFRLAHLYEVGEDKDFSVMATVDMKRIFANKKINKVKEMSLSANQEREEMEKKRLSWKVEGSNTNKGKVLRGGPVDPLKLVVELSPMEIRTFIIEFNLNLSEN